MRICVFPGSFDPLTKGHLDLIERSALIFDRVIVAVLHNPSKTGRFSVEKRMEWIEKACAHLSNVTCDSFGGLLVDYMRQQNGAVVVRGLRGVADFESEFQMAQVNRTMEAQAETLFLPTSAQYASVSSSVVREIGSFGGDITPFVPATIAREVMHALHQG